MATLTGNNKRKLTSRLANAENDEDFTLNDGDYQLEKTATIKRAKKASSSSSKGKAATTTKGKEEKKFFCDECGQGFTRKHGLQRHSTSHTGLKPHQCDQCPKKFSLLSSLREHQRTHITSHPYECTECEKKFTDRSSLRRHARSHSGTLPFACPHHDCKRRFARKDALTAHRYLLTPTIHNYMNMLISLLYHLITS
jgi:uncharacterized Zn-finger protein